MTALTELISPPNPAWSTAVPDWAGRIVARESILPQLPLFDAVADKALQVFKLLRVPDIHGTPTFGEVSEQWVFDLVRTIFGAYDPLTKRRMISEIFLLIPKKNTKTTIAAAIILTAMIINERPKAEALLIAPTKEVADLAFGQMAGMIALDADLRTIFSVRDHVKQIDDLRAWSLGTITIKAADADVITGSKATYILIDETHVFASKSAAAGVFTEIRGSLASRPDGFLMQITTQSKKPPAGVFKDELNRARAVRDGKLTLPILAVLYELPLSMSRDGGWKDQRTWPMVNPNLGRSVDPTFLANQLIAAEEAGAEALALLASQHFNVEVGLALAADRWAAADHWIGAAEKVLTLDDIIARCEVVTVGIDGGGLDDLMALAVIGRERDTRDWLLWVRAWAQPEVFERRKQIAPTLQGFIADGDLVVVEDTDQDARDIADICERLYDADMLPEAEAIGLDAFGVGTLLDEILGRGIPNEMLNSVAQGFKLQGAVLTLPRKLKDKRMRHANQPLMAWAVGNAKVELRGSNYLITKQSAGSAKIDPVMATLNAAVLMMNNPESRLGGIDGMLANPVMIL